MKLLIKLNALLVTLTAFIILCCPAAQAAEYHDTLRVGIYYGSGVINDISFESESGFLAGYSIDRDFYPCTTISNTSVSVSKNSDLPYHVLYSTHSTKEELSVQLEYLKTEGMDVFPAYFNSSYCVFGGSYKNNNDALWAAENLAVKGTPVSVSSNALFLFDTSSKKVLFVMDSTDAGLSVFRADFETNDALITISGANKGTYRGGFECKLLSSDGLTVVNIIPVEEYLYSVVCREMSSSWPVEALKAQAVCARNFALGRINYHKQYGFDVCRTVCCQAYSTTADQSTSVHTAVDGTRGELLFYQDDLVQAVYSSSMGSSTENVKNVWGTSYPYLVSVENPYEDTENIYNGKWTKTLTKARASEIMKSRGYEIGDVIEIKALEYSDAGRVLKLLVKGTNGEKIFERESCRTIFSEATYSQKYTVGTGGMTSYPVVYVDNGSKTTTKTLNSVYVLSGNKKTSAISGNYVVTNGTKEKKYNTQKIDGDSDTFVFSGEGWGHGVGMSQYGAKGMAEAGFTYNEILTHYYTGTHLEKAY